MRKAVPLYARGLPGLSHARLPVREEALNRPAVTHVEAFQQAIKDVPALVLCNIQAVKGLPIVAVRGECPVHGGDACLYHYGQLVGVRNALSDLDREGLR